MEKILDKIEKYIKNKKTDFEVLNSVYIDAINNIIIIEYYAKVTYKNKTDIILKKFETQTDKLCK